MVVWIVLFWVVLLSVLRFCSLFVMMLLKSVFWVVAVVSVFVVLLVFWILLVIWVW